MKRLQWIGLVMAAALVLLAGCNQDEEPADQGTEEQRDEQTASDAEDGAAGENQEDEAQIDMAKGFIDQLNEGNYEEATENFDDTMNEQVTAADLEEIWTGLNSQLGDFIDQDYDRTEEADGYQVVLITGTFNDADVTFQVTFDENGQIAGFFVQ
ncbi:DUF3887 domain-containing protein [Ralstonia pickettii]|nr:DUF3887 domain-containing protein [Ralstonia pickettii]